MLHGRCGAWALSLICDTSVASSCHVLQDSMSHERSRFKSGSGKTIINNQLTDLWTHDSPTYRPVDSWLINLQTTGTHESATCRTLEVTTQQLIDHWESWLKDLKTSGSHDSTTFRPLGVWRSVTFCMKYYSDALRRMCQDFKIPKHLSLLN